MATETEKGPQASISEEEITEQYTKEAEEFFKEPYVFKKPIRKVAVIGAGPSGLASAKALKEAGFDVKVFERASSIGGVWFYTETPPPKPKIPTFRNTHPIEDSPEEGTKKKMYESTPEIMKRLLQKAPPTACYRDLYNNIALPVFQFPSFPFPEGLEPFCSHETILNYFKKFAERYELEPLISLNTSVELARKDKESGEWKLSLNKHTIYPTGLIKEERWREEFDAVVVASGRHQEPYVPDFPDLLAYNKKWPDKVSHSKQFRKPEEFSKKNVLVVGGSISGVDIARSLEGFANTVTISLRQFVSPVPFINLVRGTIPKSTSIRGGIRSFSDQNGEVNGNITFTDGTVLSGIDHVIFCTGFASNIPFFNDLQISGEKENTVETFENVPESHILVDYSEPKNVFREVFLASDPTVAFVGITTEITLPPHFTVQAEAVARVWSGNAYLPNTPYMCKSILDHTFSHMAFDISVYERLRNVPFISWLNTHAKLIKNNDKELPVLENYRETFVKEADGFAGIWPEVSGKNIQQIKNRIKENTTYVY